MAHFAEIKNGIVTRVLVTDNDYPGEGYEWLIDTFGGEWIQASYNARIRKNFPGVGYTYDVDRDAFIPPKLFPSWVLDEATCQWVAPTPMPEGLHFWDEETLTWKDAK